MDLKYPIPDFRFDNLGYQFPVPIDVLVLSIVIVHFFIAAALASISLSLKRTLTTEFFWPSFSTI